MQLEIWRLEGWRIRLLASLELGDEASQDRDRENSPEDCHTKKDGNTFPLANREALVVQERLSHFRVFVKLSVRECLYSVADRWRILDPAQPTWNRLSISNESAKENHGHCEKRCDCRSWGHVISAWRNRQTDADRVLRDENHDQIHLQEVHVADAPVHNEKLQQWSNQGSWRLNHVLSNKVREGRVKLVRLFSQKDVSLQLECQNGSKEPIHEKSDADKEVAACDVCETLSCEVSSDIEIEAEHEDSWEDWLSDFGKDNLGLPLHKQLCSVDEPAKLVAKSSLSETFSSLLI